MKLVPLFVISRKEVMEMTVSNDEFIKWLGVQQHAYADLVLNAKEVGRRAPGTFYIGRAMRGEPASAGTYGNPYKEWEHGRIGCIRLYTAKLMSLPRQELLALLLPIREALDSGQKLLCWCAPLVCHGHVLAGWAKALNLTEAMHSLASETIGKAAPGAAVVETGEATGGPNAVVPTEATSPLPDPKETPTGPRFAKNSP